MNKKLNEELYYVGVNDHDIDLFESQFIVPNGMAYNSYVIKDELTAVIDSVEIRFYQEWINNIKEALNGLEPNFLIIQHMEPDHSSSIMKFLEAFPNTFVIGNLKTFKMIEQFFHQDIKHKLVVNDLDTINLGKHTLTFYFAPMVHWPEVMFTYDDYYKTIFTADAFGKFGALDVNEDWACEARRYYFGIVGKYGMQVQAILKKISNLDIQRICPLHGPVLDEDLPYYLRLYDIWSSYCNETDGVAIFYTSVYGHTKEAVTLLAEKLKEQGCPKVVVNDLARSDIAECVEDAFRYPKIVLATTTYNAGIFPFMNIFLNELIEKNYQNKVIGVIENGSWFPQAQKVIKEKLTNCKNIVFLPSVTINSSLDEKSNEQLEILLKSLLEAKEVVSYQPKEKEVEEKKKGYVCKICGYVYDGEEIPDDFKCPNCYASKEAFEKL